MHHSSVGSSTHTSSPRWSSSDRISLPSAGSTRSQTSTASAALRASQASRRARAAPACCLVGGQSLLQQHRLLGLGHHRPEASLGRRRPHRLGVGVGQHHRQRYAHLQRGLGPEHLGSQAQAAHHHQLRFDDRLGLEDPGQPRPHRVGHRVVLVAPQLGRLVAEHHQAMTFDRRVAGDRRQRVGRAQLGGHPVARTALLGGGRFHRQPVHQVVHGIAGVALDPPEGRRRAARPPARRTAPTGRGWPPACAGSSPSPS